MIWPNLKYSYVFYIALCLYKYYTSDFILIWFVPSFKLYFKLHIFSTFIILFFSNIKGLYFFEIQNHKEHLHSINQSIQSFLFKYVEVK